MSDVSVPSGWKIVRMDDVGTLYCGQSPKTNDVNRDGVGTPYFTGPEQWDGSTLHADKWTSDPKRIVPDGCIFITVKGAGVGKLFAGRAGAIGRDVYAFKPHEGICGRFVEYSLRFNIDQLVRHAKGDIPGLSKAHILDHLAVIPPLPEQRRIVSKIEELFSDLDAGVSALERAKANLKRYRASVLKAAVEGRLTADWRAANPDIEPATELLHRILTTRRQTWESNQLAEYERKGKKPPAGWEDSYIEPVSPQNTPDACLPNGWCWATVDQLATVGTGTTPKRSERRFYDGGTIPWVTSTAVNEPNVYAGTEHVTEIALSETTLKLYPKHTLIVALYGEGKTGPSGIIVGRG